MCAEQLFIERVVVPGYGHPLIGITCSSLPLNLYASQPRRFWYLLQILWYTQSWVFLSTLRLPRIYSTFVPTHMCTSKLGYRIFGIIISISRNSSGVWEIFTSLNLLKANFSYLTIGSR